MEDLQQFLEFQVPRQWAPAYSDLPLAPRHRKFGFPSLKFTFMGPKLYVNTTKVIFRCCSIYVISNIVMLVVVLCHSIITNINIWNGNHTSDHINLYTRHRTFFNKSMKSNCR